MVKLKRMDEAQLSLFDWKDKNAPIEEPEQTSSITDTNTPEVYDGLSDTDESKWFNTEFLNRKYNEYNNRFFGGKLPDVKLGIKTRQSQGQTLGTTRSEGIIRLNQITPKSIDIANKKFSNRYTLENVLLHEMCHVHQIANLCNGDYSDYAKDCKKGSGTHGHGPKFFQAADLINKSSDNKEGFKVTQYNEEENVVTNRPMKKIDGWVYIDPRFYGVSMFNIPDTPTGRSILPDVDKNNLFTYATGESKSHIMSIIGRSSKRKIVYWKYMREICNMVKTGALKPVVPDSQLKDVYLISDFVNGGKEIEVTSTYDKPTNKVQVVMLEPYNSIQKRFHVPQPLSNRSNSSLYDLYMQAVDLGVFDVEVSSRITESVNNKEDMSDIIADADNTLSIVSVSDDVEEIIIE